MAVDVRNRHWKCLLRSLRTRFRWPEPPRFITSWVTYCIGFQISRICSLVVLSRGSLTMCPIPSLRILITQLQDSLEIITIILHINPIPPNQKLANLHIAILSRNKERNLTLAIPTLYIRAMTQ